MSAMQIAYVFDIFPEPKWKWPDKIEHLTHFPFNLDKIQMFQECYDFSEIAKLFILFPKN